MELKDLTPEETVTFMGLLREVITADGEYSEAERVKTTELTGLLGEDRFNQAIADAQARFKSRAQLKEAAKKLDREEARKAIFDFLVGVAVADGLDTEEEKPLSWLAHWWELQPS